MCLDIFISTDKDSCKSNKKWQLDTMPNLHRIFSFFRPQAPCFKKPEIQYLYIYVSMCYPAVYFVTNAFNFVDFSEIFCLVKYCQCPPHPPVFANLPDFLINILAGDMTT